MNPLRALCLGTLSACSLATFDRVECSEHTECHAAFGLGVTCGDLGYCEVAELHPRCTTVYPANLTFPVDPAQTFLVGSNFDHALDTHVGRFRSAQLAAVQANANDGLDGRDFAMIHCTNEANEAFDGLDKTEAAVETAVWLADAVGVPAIVGPAASGRAEAMYNAVAVQYDTLVISPSATSPSLTPLDGLSSTDADPGLFWRTAPPDDLQGRVIAQDMWNNHDPSQTTVWRPARSQRVAVIHKTDAYGDGLAVTFEQAFLAIGGSSQSFPFADATGRSDAIASAANGDFDELLFVSSEATDIIAFLQGVANLPSLDNTPVFLTDAARNTDVVSAALGTAASVVPRVRGTAPANPAGPVYDSFKVSYAAEYGGADVSGLSFTAQAFDAMWLVVYGHAWATYQTGGDITGTHIARGLRKVSAGEAVDLRPSSWNQVKARFQQGQSVDVYGASGALDYADDGETTATIDVWVVSGAGFLVVDSVAP